MSQDLKPHRHEPIALSSESTVVREAAYQSEAWDPYWGPYWYGGWYGPYPYYWW